MARRRPTAAAPPRRLTNTRAPEKGVAWSPDSRAIAFATKREGDEADQIYLLDLAAGGEARRLTNLSTGAANPEWRPDGKAILFESEVYPNALDDEANRKIAAERKARKYNVRVYEHFPVRFWNQWLDDRQPTIIVQSLEEGAAPRDILSPTALAHTAGVCRRADGGTSLSLCAACGVPTARRCCSRPPPSAGTRRSPTFSFHLYRMAAQGGA